MYQVTERVCRPNRERQTPVDTVGITVAIGVLALIIALPSAVQALVWLKEWHDKKK